MVGSLHNVLTRKKSTMISCLDRLLLQQPLISLANIMNHSVQKSLDLQVETSHKEGGGAADFADESE